MRAFPLAFALLSLSHAALARTPDGAAAPPATPPDAPPAVSVALNVAPDERRYFELGSVLAKASFAYAALAKQASRISHTQPTGGQVSRLAKLAPDALRRRALAQDNLNRALALLQELNAPAAVLAPLARLNTTLSKPPVALGDAQNVSALSPDAGVVLAALQESSRLTGVLENAALKKWLKSVGTGQVWYAEGLIAGVSEVAARESLPDLLPPLHELATDLRGLRDWLTLRLPDAPTPEQSALQTALTQFLQQSTTVKKPKSLTRAQLQALGAISRMLQAQILAQPSPETATPTATASP